MLEMPTRGPSPWKELWRSHRLGYKERVHDGEDLDGLAQSHCVSHGKTGLTQPLLPARRAREALAVEGHRLDPVEVVVEADHRRAIEPRVEAVVHEQEALPRHPADLAQRGHQIVRVVQHGDA